MALPAPTGWAPRLRREITWLLLAKLCALLLLWGIFFSPSQRPPANAPDVAQKLALPLNSGLPEDAP